MFINILVTSALMLFTAGVAMAQYYPERRLVREGNEQFERLNYRNALNRYNEALEHDTTKYESLYNRANAYLQNMLANPADTTLKGEVANTLFGGGMTSKLFQNVREKMSLCYSIGSSYYGTKGIVVVSAGIDFDKEQLTRDEVIRQLDICREGGITEQELRAAKEALLSSLRSTLDSPGAIEGYYATAALSGLIFSHEEYMAAVEKATIEDVVKAANTLQLHTTYFLKGGSQ